MTQQRRPRPVWMRVGTTQRPRTPYVPRRLTGYGRECWHRIAPLLWRSGILSRVDLIGLEALCRCYGHWRELMDIIEGHAGTSPLEEAAAGWHTVIRAWLADFYLVPTSRAGAFTTDPLEGIGRQPKKGA
jgi:P27 family predicted phage terminase small subunit